MYNHPILRYENVLKKVRVTTLVFAVLHILLGICLLAFPDVVQQVMGIIIGIMLLGTGASRLYAYYKRDRDASIIATDLFSGVLAVIGGVLCIVFRKDLGTFLAIAYGILLIVGCIIKIQHAIDLKHMGYYRWWIPLVLGLISGVMAALVIARPALIVNVFITCTGIFFIYDGISALVAVFFSERSLKALKEGKSLGRPEPRVVPPAANPGAIPVPPAAGQVPPAPAPTPAPQTAAPDPAPAHQEPARSPMDEDFGGIQAKTEVVNKFDPDTGKPVQ